MDTKADINSCQKTGFQLDLDSGGACKQNGTNLDHIFLQRPTNGKDASSEGVYDDYDDEDYGPETDVDTVDDVLLSPAIAAAKMLASANKNELLIENNQAAVDVSPELQKDQLGELDAFAPRRGDTPTPPADEVASVNRDIEVDNAGESGEDSEDEWNYIAAVETKKQPASEPVSLPQEKSTDCDISEAERQHILDMESRLNPDAAEFIPSPTHVVPVLDECFLACSPRKDEKREIAAVPSEKEFDQEARKCPGQEIERDNVPPLIADTLVKPQFGDVSSPSSNDLQSTILQTPDFFSSSLQGTKNPFGDNMNDINERMSFVQSEEIGDFKFDSESCTKSELKNTSEPLSFELKKEICPEMEPEPERVCLDTLVDDIAENGISPTVSPDFSEPSKEEKVEFDPYLAICPPNPADLTQDLLESYVERIQAEVSSFTTLPDTTGLDETGGSLSPLDTDAIESKPDSSSDKHLFDYEPDIVPESKLVDSTTLSGSTTDSSPVNDLIDDSPVNKLIEGKDLQSEYSEAYKPLLEPLNASPLEGHIHSLGVGEEQNESVNKSLKHFSDDAPFHGFMESEPLQEHLDDLYTLQKNAENEILSEYASSVDRLHGHVDRIGLLDAVNSYNCIEDAVSSHDRIEDAVSSHDRIEDVVSSHDRIEDAVGSHDRIEDAVGSHDRIEDVVSSHDRIENVVCSHDRIEDVVSSHDRIEDVVSSHDRIEDVVSSHDRIEDAVSSHDRIEDAVGSQDAICLHDSVKDVGIHLDNALQNEDTSLNDFGVVSSTSPYNKESVGTSETTAHAESYVDDYHVKDDYNSEILDLKSDFPKELSELPVIDSVNNIIESEFAKLEQDTINVNPSAPDRSLLEESESLKFAAEVLEKEPKDDNLSEVLRSERESTRFSQTPPSTPAVIEPEVLVETVEKLIVSPNEESDVLEHLQESKVVDSEEKSILSEIAAGATASTVAAAVATGAILATQKTDSKGVAPVKAPSTKAKKPLTDKARSPAVTKAPATQKVVAASPRAQLSTSTSRAPARPSVSPTKTLTPAKKTTTTPAKPKSATTTPVTSSPTSATSTPKSKPLSARPSVGAVKPSVPLKLSAPVQKVRPTSAVNKPTGIEKKPAAITNGTVAKLPVKEQVTVRRTITSAKTSVSQPTNVTAPRQPISRTMTATKTATATSAGMAAKLKNVPPSTVGVTKARAPVSTITQKQVKETANKQISSTRPTSAVSVSRTSTTTSSRRVSTGVTRTTTTTTTSPKSNLGGKVTTKKTTTVTSRSSAPAKAKLQAIENNEHITTTVISTEMKVDPIETTQHALLE